MKFFVIFGNILLLCILASSAHGEIYAWTDVNGIMHFTNYHPPPQAKLFIKDVGPPPPEAEVDQDIKEQSEQPATESNEIQEYFEEKLDETVRRIEDFERDLEDAEILNQGLTRKLVEANQRADAALALATELASKVREATPLTYSNTLYRNAYYRYPVRYNYGISYIIHKPKFKHKRFHTKRHSYKGHFKKFSKRSHHKSFRVRTHFSKGRSVGIRHKRHFGSSYISKPHGVGIHYKRHIGSRHTRTSFRTGIRSSARFSHRNFRR